MNMSYDEKFLGVDLPLPRFNPDRAASVLKNPDFRDDILVEYPTYSVVTDKDKRAPAFVVLQIDQQQLKKTERIDRWKIDSRIGHEFQLDNAYYLRNEWDRGHMARRESAGWGNSARSAQHASDETFYFSNACLQHENVNQDEWLELEDWVLHLDGAVNGRIVVFTGPIYGDAPRVIRPAGREAADIPAAFFKVACFIGKQSAELEVRAFIVYQDEESIADKDGRKVYDYQHYQVTVREIELMTGIDFPDDVYERNPLYFHEKNDDVKSRLGIRSFPERIDVNSPSDLIGRDQRRIPVLDDDVDVYLLAAQPVPGPGEPEWVSIGNLGGKLVDIEGWVLQDKEGRATVLSGKLLPGQSIVLLQDDALGPVRLPNIGGVLKLLTADGEQIDHVDYNAKDIKKSGAHAPINFLTYRK
jgi:endonuclease G